MFIFAPLVYFIYQKFPLLLFIFDGFLNCIIALSEVCKILCLEFLFLLSASGYWWNVLVLSLGKDIEAKRLSNTN